MRVRFAGDLYGFLHFKRSLGFRYARAEFTLREFDRFLVASAHKRLPLDQAALEWLSGKPGRKPVSVSGDAAVLRQLFAFLRRSPDRAITEPRWPRLPTESVFVPYFLSEQDVLRLVARAPTLRNIAVVMLYQMRAIMAMTFDADAPNAPLLYVNGVLEGQVAASPSFANTGGLAFGYSKWLGGRLDGTDARIDDVRAYGIALTAAQVQALFQGN